MCVQAGLFMGNTWSNGEPTAFFHSDVSFRSSTRLHDYTAFGQECLDKGEIETCYELGKSLQLTTQYDHVHVRLPPANPSCPRWNDAALRWAMRDESLCEAYLSLDDWYGFVMEIIQQVASHHFGVKLTSPSRHWMTPEAWNDIVTCQAQVSKLVEFWRARSQIDDSRSIVFRMWHTTARLGVLERRIRASCREAKARHTASTRAQLEEALRADDYRAAREQCRLLAGHSRRSVKPRAVLPGKALDQEALEKHMKKVFGATSSLVPPRSFSVRHTSLEFISQ